MFSYIIKRLLLIPPVFFGTTLLVFFILVNVPGGPFERAIMQLKMSSLEKGGAESESLPSHQMLSPEVLEAMRKQFGLDKSFFTRYLIWLGLMPREIKSEKININNPFREDLKYFKVKNRIFTLQRWVKVSKINNKPVVLSSGAGTDFFINDKYNELPDAEFIIDWKVDNEWEIVNKEDNVYNIARKSFKGILTGYLGKSYTYDEKVITLIIERLPISAIFGLTGFLLSYLISIPLGILKALKHGTKFDVISSIFIFIGYSVPGYIIGALLLVLLGGGSFLNLFPLGGIVSDNFASLSLLGKVFDLLHHITLPVTCYTAGSFATLTILMKNSLLETLAEDYIRTAKSKGLNEFKTITVHALRNSLIPMATGMGQIIGIFLAGSYFIEKVFNIDGIGMLSYQSIISADYPVIMGFLVINTLILLFGNIISDLLYCLIDPRIRIH